MQVWYGPMNLEHSELVCEQTFAMEKESMGQIESWLYGQYDVYLKTRRPKTTAKNKNKRTRKGESRMKQSYETSACCCCRPRSLRPRWCGDYYCRIRLSLSRLTRSGNRTFLPRSISGRLLVQDEETASARRLSFLHRAKGTARADHRHGGAQQRGVGQLLLLLFGV